uniref:F-box domain-containing protein n=1 Tax=Caenorhabditis tropicalis TaxID=1561998 RepID=A0A1I7TVM6_9PELO
MFVPSLFELSATVVAKYSVDGSYRNLDINLDTKLSDQVFPEIVKLYRLPRLSVSSPLIREEIGLKLNLSKFDTNGYPVSRGDLVKLHSHNIRSLAVSLVDIPGVQEYWVQNYEEDEEQLDIVRILKTCLNERSRQNLMHLSCDCFEYFPNNWSESIGELLPNLVSFAPIFIKDLRGVCHLKNLQILTLSRSSLKSTENLKDVFELRNLRVLNVSESEFFFEALLLCNGTFQNLKLIDFFKSDISETQLRTLVERNPSLETISLLETPCDYTDFSDLPVTVFNLATIESTMNTLRFSLDKRDAYGWRVSKSIDRLVELMCDITIQGFKEDEFLKMMMEVIKKCPSLRKKSNEVTDCLILYFKHFFPGQSMREILKKLDPKSPLFVERRWAAQTVLRFFLEPVHRKLIIRRNSF